jgi:hypothetical protein
MYCSSDTALMVLVVRQQKLGICQCCSIFVTLHNLVPGKSSGLGLGQNLVPGMRIPVRLLLRMAI